MEGIFFLLFLSFIFFVVSQSGKGSNEKAKAKAKARAKSGSDVPDMLRAKWAAQDDMNTAKKQSFSDNNVWSYKPSSGDKKASQSQSRANSRSADMAASRAAVRATSLLRRAKDERRANRDNQSRTEDAKMRDLNFNRRVDWGTRGAGRTVLAPLIISFLVGAAIAVLLMTE